MLEAFVYQRVYTQHAVDCSRVYVRKRSAAMLEPQIAKLLIQNMLTLANRTQGPVYRQHPIWG